MGKQIIELCGLDGHPSKYSDENVVEEKLQMNAQQQEILEKKQKGILNKINDFCGITGADFNREKCYHLLDATFKYIPDAKKIFEDSREAFKKATVNSIRQKQYNGGLLSDFSYLELGQLNTEKLEKEIMQLETEKIQSIGKSNLNNIQDKITTLKNAQYMMQVLKQKGFKLETIRQKTLSNEFSAMYIENIDGEGFFVIRGTSGQQGIRGDAQMGLTSGGFHPQTSSALQTFEEIVPKGKKVVVYGHSLGGHLAQAIGLKYYDRVNEIITYDAPGLKRNDNKYRIIQELFAMRPTPYSITNIIIDTKNCANNTGTRIGQTATLKGVHSHPISGMNKRLVDMSLSDMKKWEEENQKHIMESQKEYSCTQNFTFNKEFCKKNIGEMKKNFSNKPNLLKILDETEKNIDGLEIKNEILTYAMAQDLQAIHIAYVRSKYPNFFEKSLSQKYRFIVDLFFKDTETEECILKLLKIYALEKNGYDTTKIIGVGGNIGANFTIFPHKNTHSQIIAIHFNIDPGAMQKRFSGSSLPILMSVSMEKTTLLGLKADVKGTFQSYEEYLNTQENKLISYIKQFVVNKDTVVVGSGVAGNIAKKMALIQNISRVITFDHRNVFNNNQDKNEKNILNFVNVNSYVIENEHKIGNQIVLGKKHLVLDKDNHLIFDEEYTSVVDGTDYKTFTKK